MLPGTSLVGWQRARASSRRRAEIQEPQGPDRRHQWPTNSERSKGAKCGEDQNCPHRSPPARLLVSCSSHAQRTGRGQLLTFALLEVSVKRGCLKTLVRVVKHQGAVVRKGTW